MKKYFIVLVIVGILVFAFSYFMFENKDKQESGSETPTKETEKQISLSEVGLHNSKDNCWIAIEGGVYDVSKFVSKHPGGEIILTACGTDATNKFNNRPTNGTSHSNLAHKMLQSLRLGSLSD